MKAYHTQHAPDLSTRNTKSPEAANKAIGKDRFPVLNRADSPSDQGWACPGGRVQQASDMTWRCCPWENAFEDDDVCRFQTRAFVSIWGYRRGAIGNLPPEPKIDGLSLSFAA